MKVKREHCKACFGRGSVYNQVSCRECQGQGYISIFRKCSMKPPECHIIDEVMVNGWECLDCGRSGPY